MTLQMKIRPFAYLLVIAVSFQIFTMWSASHLTSAGAGKNAYIKDIKYEAKIQPNKFSEWTIIVYNANCNATSNRKAKFFLRFYFNDQLWLDEYNHTWECGINESVDRTYRIHSPDVMDPRVYNVKIELYWFDGHSSTLEDFTTFKMMITLLIPLQHIRVLSYLAAYLLICIGTLSFFYISEYGIKD